MAALVWHEVDIGSVPPFATLPNVPVSEPVVVISVNASPRLSAGQLAPLLEPWITFRVLPFSATVPLALSCEKSVPGAEPFPLMKAVVVRPESTVTPPWTPRGQRA